MVRVSTRIIFAVLLSGAAFGQAGANKPAFDVADVRVSPRSDWVKKATNSMQGGFLSAGRYEIRRATMLDMIRIAYSVDADKIYGGPNWLDYDRFEVNSKAPPGTRPEILRLMLQSLLEDRFKLVVKPDSKPMPAYVLSKGKGDSKLKAAEDASASSSGCQSLRPVMEPVPTGTIQCRNVTMEAFAPALRRLNAASFGNLAVVDSTGIEGTWDIDLKYPLRVISVSAAGAAENSSSGTIFDAVEKQLGLKLELQKLPQPVLAVESVAEQPTANPPGVAAALPPLPPPEFEVASIRPCSDNMSITPRFESGGRVSATCMPLLSLITQAFNLAPFEQPVGVPKWLGDNSTAHNITIVAKAPAGASPDPQNNPQARDILNAMVRALLMDRYKMVVHYEDQPRDAYTLVAAKPKLTKADPSNRTGCTRENQQNPGALRLVCQNITIAQFAEQIQSYDSQIFYPVLNGTGIDGAWDFTLSYSLAASLPRLGRGGPVAGPNGEPADPSGALSFIQAVEKQLGLKLETHKRSVPVLVIDHIEEKPTEN